MIFLNDEWEFCGIIMVCSVLAVEAEERQYSV